jgi:predicted GH43/DUF377 family glycosyl hydrolase
MCTGYTANPVLNDSGEYTARIGTTNYTAFATDYQYSSVLFLSGTYHMWFSGLVSNVSGIFTATSSDGVNWVVRSSPVLTLGSKGSWDNGSIYSPDVIWNGTMYLMYYVGTGTNAYREIGLAFSGDGVNWRRYPQNPVLKFGPGFYDSWYTRFPSVILDNGTYKMWYTGHTLTNTSAPWYIATDYATSADGIHWTKYAGNPVYGGGSNWTSYSLYEHPSVAKIDGTYIMVGDDGIKLSYATSTDGVHWTSIHETLVSPSTSSSSTFNPLFPTVLVNGTQLLVWYTGSNMSAHQEYLSGINLAYCQLLIVPTTVSTTVTRTVIVTSPSVTTVTSTVVTEITITESPAYQSALEVSAVVLGVLLVATLLILARYRVPRT